MTDFMLSDKLQGPNQNFVETGAMAEQLGSGLQNRVHRCDSGSRLGIGNSRRGGGTGRRTGLKILYPSGCAGSTPAPGSVLKFFRVRSSVSATKRWRRKGH